MRKTWARGNAGERDSRQQEWNMQRSWGSHKLAVLKKQKKTNMSSKARGAWERSEKQARAKSGRAS